MVNETTLVILAQLYLTAVGRNAGAADGFWGNRTQAAYEALQGVSNLWVTSREITKLAQTYLRGLGLYKGRVDGSAGPETKAAINAWLVGTDWVYPHDAEKTGGRKNLDSPWPRDTEAELTAFFGPPGDESQHVMCTPCYPLRLSWELDTIVTRFTCHGKVKESLERVFEAIRSHYNGDLGAIRAARMDRFSGCYNNRPRKGGKRPSLHARAAAIDLDAENNQFRWGREEAKMPEAIIDLFAAEHWVSGGREWGYDFMHFQATS